MDDGPLKAKLQQCRRGPFRRTDFSIAHRGAPMRIPEHTREAYEAGARMGAGIVECDVTFTKDGELVCRHDECDLATTTDIVTTGLNKSCSVPYAGKGSGPRCCASDLTLAEFRTLKGKMESADPEAADAAGFLGGVPAWREAPDGIRGTLLTLRESIALNERLGVKHTPELKAGDPERIKQVFGSQGAYAQKMIDEFKRAGVDPSDVFPQSFNLEDIRYWIKNEPAFGRQAVYLDDVDPTGGQSAPDAAKSSSNCAPKACASSPRRSLRCSRWMTPGKSCPRSTRATSARRASSIITWTFERSDLRGGAATAGWYWAFDPQGPRRQEGRRHVPRARRARARSRHPRNVLGLAGDGDLLRELHGRRACSRLRPWTSSPSRERGSGRGSGAISPRCRRPPCHTSDAGLPSNCR